MHGMKERGAAASSGMKEKRVKIRLVVTFEVTTYAVGGGCARGVSLVPGAHEKREAPGTHCLRMRLISPRCGDSGLFLDSSVLCDVRVRTRYSKVVRTI